MFEPEEVVTLLALGSMLVAVAAYFAVRIGLLVRRQRLAERALRMQIALHLGRIAREERTGGA